MSCTFSNFNCLQESYARKIGIESILNTWVRRIIGGIISSNLKVEQLVFVPLNTCNWIKEVYFSFRLYVKVNAFLGYLCDVHLLHSPLECRP